jgi:hypothetical protein
MNKLNIKNIEITDAKNLKTLLSIYYMVNISILNMTKNSKIETTKMKLGILKKVITVKNRFIISS